jgi:integrase
MAKHYPLIAPKNPCVNVDRMKVDPYGRATFLDTSPEKREDFRLLESLAVDDSYAGARDFALVLTLLTTALRVAALVKAKRRDLIADGEGGKLTYKIKGNKTDDMPIRPNTYAAITAYLSRRLNEDGYVKKDDPLFLYDGKSITSTHIQRIIRRRSDVVFGKGHGITPHSLRHTAAIITSDEGSFSEVFALLRHSSARVTSIYLQHIDKKRAGAKAGSRLDDRYGSA